MASGYGGVIERVDGVSGRVLARAGPPHGSLALSAGDAYGVTSSLLSGPLAICE